MSAVDGVARNLRKEEHMEKSAWSETEDGRRRVGKNNSASSITQEKAEEWNTFLLLSTFCFS